MTVRYAGSPESIVVSLVREWARGDIVAPVMSASSGPKDYLKNQIFAAFDADPGLERIRLVVGEYLRSAPFALFYRSGSWSDASGRAVEMSDLPRAVSATGRDASNFTEAAG